MELGYFSLSLNVKDIAASKAFYEKLGYEVIGGELEQKWQIMRSGDQTIGLFQGMLEKNTLTFNPGWDKNTNKLECFDDIRTLQKQLVAKGITPINLCDEDSVGPASFIVKDPGGNPILFDQHV